MYTFLRRIPKCNTRIKGAKKQISFKSETSFLDLEQSLFDQDEGFLYLIRPLGTFYLFV